MKRWKQLWLGTIVMAGVAGLVVLTPLTTEANVSVHIDVGVPVAPNPPIYHYVYYPDQEVYFVPETRVYWWMDDNGVWVSAPRVPADIVLGASVNLDVDARDPWRHHAVILEKFPGHRRHVIERERGHEHGHEHEHDHDHDGH